MSTIRDNKIDLITTKDADYHQRRITNAGASQDANDYVIQSELTAATTTSSSSSSGIYYSLSFMGTLAIASDIMPRLLVSSNSSVSFLRADVKQAPTGASLAIKVYQNTVAMATVLIAAGATSGTIATNTRLTKNSYLRVDITTIGSTFAGADLTVTLG